MIGPSLLLLQLLNLLFKAYYIIVLVHVFGSWIPPTHAGTPWAKVLALAYALTQPVLRPIRRVLHPYQRSLPFDFSPLVLLIALMLLQGILVQLLFMRP